jgi:threonine/homoserine/homoserine lactone efflux protein
MQTLSYFFLGMVLSFLGQLPLGTMSFTATQIAVQENFRNAWKYALGVAVIEMMYLYGVLWGIQWVNKNPVLFIIFNWISVFVFLILGMLAFAVACKQEKNKKTLLLNNRIDRFLLGIIMSALNPAQIPFWFIWTDYFLTMGWLASGTASFNIFTMGAGSGTVGGLAVYIYGGNWLVSKMKTSNRTLNILMGIIFILAAGLQLYRMLRH